MNSEPAQKRPLSSLTPTECQILFALAFGYAPPSPDSSVFKLGGYSKLTIWDSPYTLTVYQNGALLAQKQNFPSDFNAYNVVGYLAALNINFGDDPSPKRALSDLSTDEGNSLFRAAFNHEPEDDIIISVWEMKSCITISDGYKLLTLSDQGTATIHRPPFDRLESIMWPSIQPQSLVNCLKGLNVQFGSQSNQSGK